MALFAYFYASGFEAAAKAKFLSLESSSGNCEQIGTQLDIELYATSDGAWEGFKRFKAQQAKYLFKFQGFQKECLNEIYIFYLFFAFQVFFFFILLPDYFFS